MTIPPLAALFPFVIAGSFFLLLVVERLWPARALPKVRFWLPRGIVFFAFNGVVNSVVPAALSSVVGPHAPLHLGWLGTIAGGLLGALVSDFVGYWLHRLTHLSSPLWRWTHQMHHSAERMDLAGLGYTHPFDTLFMFTTTIAAMTLLGLTPNAAALAGFLGYATAVFHHMNIRTPRWLGFIVTRPEAHAIHHARGIHAYNYASFPIWDIVFGTFRSPARGSFPEAYGFWDGASNQVGQMMIGRDIGERESKGEMIAS